MLHLNIKIVIEWWTHNNKFKQNETMISWKKKIYLKHAILNINRLVAARPTWQNCRYCRAYLRVVGSHLVWGIIHIGPYPLILIKTFYSKVSNKNISPYIGIFFEVFYNKNNIKLMYWKCRFRWFLFVSLIAKTIIFYS